ncbi:hypothetical protein RQP54_19110 [Curvibacter sp. APW13]|uniref:hypothetical protein n=1 Tax=Curvibacter sp. APW13 TaxID=3077236 RepID=UPI0028DD9A72|nr:hypothetical protein [Curvibacter sp. APW13]MDT8992991.1 hypothetical protein [Curvibacter sp. APW13]
MNTPRALKYLLITATLACTTVLSGCGLPRMIDSDVQSFVGGEGAVTGVGYRFERLPSQQARSDQQESIEAMAEQALSEVGLHRDDKAPRYSAQVSVGVRTIAPPEQRRARAERSILRPDGVAVFMPPFGLVIEPPWYRHSVQLLLRDVGTSKVAFESTASFDGPWADSTRLLPVVMRAALRDYPNPPPGPRKVVIELPADGTPADE